MTFDLDALKKNIFNNYENRKKYDEYIRYRLDIIDSEYKKLNFKKYSPDNKALQLCYFFCAHKGIEKKVKEIENFAKSYTNFYELSYIEQFKVFCEMKISKNFSKVSETLRKRDIEVVNLVQENYLNENLDILYEENKKINNIKLDKNKRFIVLYFRDYNVNGIFVDSFEFFCMIYILDKYISNSFSKLFTNIIITSKKNDRFLYMCEEIFSNVKYNHYSNNTNYSDHIQQINISNKEFDILCGIQANTVHFTHGISNELVYDSIPILKKVSSMDPLKIKNSLRYQNKYNNTNKTKLIENVDYVTNPLNYESYNNSYLLSDTLKLFKYKYYSIEKVMNLFINSVEKLEEVVIEQARIKLTNGTYY
jgi:hypothetical protein